VPHDPQPELYAQYVATLEQLRAGEPLDIVLRRFEKRLLDLLGYGNDLRSDAAGRAVEPKGLYHFRPGAGLWVAERADDASAVEGRVLLALAAEVPLSDVEGQRQARQVLRAALDHCLDGRELRVRAVARAVARMERSC